MNFTKKTWGILLFPALAIGYATFTLWEQLSGNYKEITTDYTLMLAVPILFLAGIISLQEIFPVWGRVMILRALFAEPPKALEDDAGGEELGAGEFFFSGIGACAVNMVERLADKDDIGLEWMDVSVESYRDSDIDHGDLTLYDAIRIKFEMWGVDDEDAHNLVETWKKR